MAPVKRKGKPPASRSSKSAPADNAKSKDKPKGPPPKQVKTKSAKSLDSKKPRKKVYSAKELGVPELNMITPIGVQKPRGKKKGKVFVDDPHTMQTILSIVNAETEGKIESKMLRARQMEEIRDARQKEADVKEQSRRDAVEKKKDELRRGKKRIRAGGPTNGDVTVPSPKKKVSFG